MESTIFLTQRQLAAWSTAPRPEIVDALLAQGPLSVAELARALGRKPKGLYYHLRALEEAGLVEVKEVRRASRRNEAVYGLVSRSMIIAPDLSDPEYRAAINDSVAATIRGVQRHHRRVVDAAVARPELWDLSTVLTTTVRLRPEDVRELHERARELHQRAKQAHDPTESQAYALFVAVLPVVPRSDQDIGS